MTQILFETALLFETIFLEATFLKATFLGATLLQTSWADGDRQNAVGGSA